jgi:hypothetical protein
LGYNKYFRKHNLEYNKYFRYRWLASDKNSTIIGTYGTHLS